jgi:hypothetical protein
MYPGAIALIDALGFRGIWDRHEPDDVLIELKTMQGWINERIVVPAEPSLECRVGYLSDTLAVSTLIKESINDKPAWSALHLGAIVSRIMDRTLRSKVPLAYRGAIDIGIHEVSPHFIIGPAVDQAATVYDLAQGAFVWFAPKARDEVSKLLKANPHLETFLVEFDVPFKNGDRFNTYTVSPLAHARDTDDANLLTRSLLGTFSGSNIDIAIKRQNTMRHIRACYASRQFDIPAELSAL